jgi:Xaa-Pro aminopeptidase
MIWMFQKGPYFMSPVKQDNLKNKETFKVPASEIKQRTRNIQVQLQQHDIDGLFIVQRVDLFYFSGTSQNGFLYIPAEGEPVLLIRQYLPRARTESSIKNIIEIKSIKEIPALLNDIYGRLPGVLGFELDVLPVNDFYFYRSIMQAQKNVDASPSILKLRMNKSDWEIQQMQKTAELTRKTFEYMQKTIRPGLSEMEFAAMAETYARKLGHSGGIRARHYQTEGYFWHIISGKNSARVGLLNAVASGEGTSAAFPVGAGNKKLKSHEPVMIDMALVLNGYHLDDVRKRVYRRCRKRICRHRNRFPVDYPNSSRSFHLLNLTLGQIMSLDYIFTTEAQRAQSYLSFTRSGDDDRVKKLSTSCSFCHSVVNGSNISHKLSIVNLRSFY